AAADNAQGAFHGLLAGEDYHYAKKITTSTNFVARASWTPNNSGANLISRVRGEAYDLTHGTLLPRTNSASGVYLDYFNHATLDCELESSEPTNFYCAFTAGSFPEN